MDNKLLTTFITVVEEKSFSKAAEVLYLSQSTISTHIKNLETMLETQLLLRSMTGIVPTKSGRIFYPYAKNIIALENQAVHSISKMNDATAGEIDILASTVPAQFFLNKIIASFRAFYPKVTFRVNLKSSYDVIDSLEAPWYDFAVIGAKFESDLFYATPIYDDNFVLAVPNSFPLPKDNSAEEISNYIKQHPLVFRSEQSATQADTKKLLKKLGVSLSDLTVAAYLGDSQSVVDAVFHEVGVAFLSSAAVEIYSEHKAIQTVKLPDDFLHRKFYLLARKEYVLPPIQGLFYDYVTKDWHISSS